MVNLADRFEIWIEKYMSSSIVKGEDTPAVLFPLGMEKFYLVELTARAMPSK